MTNVRTNSSSERLPRYALFLTAMRRLLLPLVIATSYANVSSAATLLFEFEGEWENDSHFTDPLDPLGPLVGTRFSGSLSIPDSGVDLNPDNGRGQYEFMAPSVQFTLDNSGDAFDIAGVAKADVIVLNDSPGLFTTSGLPLYDSVLIEMESNGYYVALGAGIRSGSVPPTSFSSDRIPTIVEIESTASFSVSMWPTGGVSADDVFLTSSHPYPALQPPGSVNDLLDVTITLVPIPAAFVNMIFAIAALGTRLFAQRHGGMRAAIWKRQR